ncbi:Cleavage and polyadenylation specificity factor subunit 2 [Halotydeus destructor]|nr:Cleavage and polyadenylation specificity factor subunit 2 [Halotydeus destructor]
MTSIIKLEALSGAFEESPPCYLLQVDDFRFLLDCGWNEMFNMDVINKVRKHVKHIDAVLLSHPDAAHIGALPYIVGKLGLNCPVYATVPVYKMGQMFMYDLHQSRHKYEDFTLFSLDDIDVAFSKVIQLKYNQSVTFKGKGEGITIVPLPAGHMIGGTIWKISKDGEEDIVYAMDFNHKKERHLNGGVLDSLTVPNLLIVDAFNAAYTQTRRRDRDEELMTTILATLRKGGNVLVSVDTAGRVLELAYMLDQLWRSPDSGLGAYSLALLSTVSFNVIEFAKSQVEWMSDKIMKSFEGQRNNPFHFKNLQLCYDMQMLSKIREPRVVLASQPDLECGFAKELFLNLATSPLNTIILTQKTGAGTLAEQLRTSADKNVTVKVNTRVPLEGWELEEYRKAHQTKTDKQNVKVESDSEESESEAEEDIEDDFVKKPKSEIRHDLMMKTEGKTKGSFFKQAKRSYLMYPYVETKIKWDDYGEIINPEDYMKIDHAAVGAKRGADEDKENKVKEEEPMLVEVKEIPTKCLVNVKSFKVEASISYIDFEGRSDGESLKKILSLVKPRRLIVVRGSPESVMDLASFCKTNLSLSDESLFTPKNGEVVDATTESHIYQVRLTDSLVTSLSFSKAKGGAELAWLEAELEMPEEESLLPKQEVAKGTSQSIIEKSSQGGRDLLPTLKPLDLNASSSHVTLFVNELKLSDFKQVLINSGVQAEFAGGVLYCSDKVAVRRNETGRIHLEGTICEEYFKIRQLLYKQYAVV